MQWRLSELQLDWFSPWLWPRYLQNTLWLGSGVLGICLLSPWWWHSWQMWGDANDAQIKLIEQQETIQALRIQTKQLLQSQNQAPVPFVDVVALAQLAQKQDLEVSQINLGQPQRSPTMVTLQMHELPLHIKVQGSWHGWLSWLAQWPTAAPGVTVSSLELKANPQEGISMDMVAAVPESIVTEPALALSRMNTDIAASNDPFSRRGWEHAKYTHATQHPSYARLVAPELLRVRDVLEDFPRDRLQYVGQIASNGKVEALVKVLPSADAQKDTRMVSVYRVRVGQRLGRDFGKVLAITSNELVIQELVLDVSGTWQTREARLPLHGVAP